MQRLPDKVVKASKRIEAYPYDTEAWSVLTREAQVSSVKIYLITEDIVSKSFDRHSCSFNALG